jgi:hypothetical protein
MANLCIGVFKKGEQLYHVATYNLKKDFQKLNNGCTSTAPRCSHEKISQPKRE